MLVRLIYVDHNILIDVFKGNIELPNSADIVWAYSNEHFAEIVRSRNEELLDCLDRLHAQRIRIELSDGFKISDWAILDREKSPSEYFREYLSEINKFPTIDFVPLLSFLSGNKNDFDIVGFSDNFKSALKKLDLFGCIGEKQKIIKEHLNSLIELVGDRLSNELHKSNEKIIPRFEVRNHLAGQGVSNITDINGKIVDEIWNRMDKAKLNLTKDQFFGKEPFPFVGAKSPNPYYLQIIQCYYALNTVGYWPDKKLSYVKKIYGINSDASHVGHAAFCPALLSEDERLCRKAAAIYQYFDIDTQVINIKLLSRSNGIS